LNIIYITLPTYYQRLNLFSNPPNPPISRRNGYKARVKNLKNSLPIILLPIIIVANHSAQPAPLHGPITTLLPLAYRESVRYRNNPPCRV